MAWRKSPPELIALFDEAVPKDRRIERRKMFGYPAAFLNGYLFAGLHQESFVLKLSPPDRDRLVAERHASMFEPVPGRPMREFVVLPQSVLSERPALATWIEQSIVYIAGMPPKVPKPATAKKATPSKARGSKRG
jgi:TfoX/Sxy family transcriptional regulator of competence genes